MKPSVNKSLEVVGVIPRGRPTSFTQEVADEICKRMWEGHTLTAICREDDMPALRTVYGWMDQSPQFQHEYARARARMAFTHGDEVIDTARDRTIDPDRARVVVDALKWRAARMNSRHFGDKVQVETQVVTKELDATELPGGIGWLARLKKERQDDGQ